MVKPIQCKLLYQRILKDNEYFRNSFNESEKKFIEGIVEGQFVALGLEGIIQNMRHTFQSRYPTLYISDNKYYYNPLAIPIGRRHEKYKQILAGYYL